MQSVAYHSERPEHEGRVAGAEHEEVLDDEQVVEVLHLPHRNVHDGLRQRRPHGADDGEERRAAARSVRREQDRRPRHEQHADERRDSADEIHVVDSFSENHSRLRTHFTVLGLELQRCLGSMRAYQEEGEDWRGEDDNHGVRERHVRHGVERQGGAGRSDQAAEEQQESILPPHEQVRLLVSHPEL